MSFRFSSALVQVLAGAVLLGAAGSGSAQVQGAGASFPSKVYEKWAKRFEQETGEVVVYKPTGSGDGLVQVSARAVDFGGSDTPLSAQELTKRRLVQLPMLVGGIVPVVNLPGVGANQLVLSGEVLADIMSGRIIQWNDTRVTGLNPGLALPARPIVRVVRADKSGTTQGLTRYLSDVSASFRADVGVGQSPQWPGKVVPAEGNDGVAQALKRTPGAISYVSYDRVIYDGLAGVRMRKAGGLDVVASEMAFRAAVLDSDVSRQGDDLASLMNRPAAQAWPITQTSFVLLDQAPANNARASQAMRFVYWCFMRGDELTSGTGFAPLPIALQARLAKRLATVAAKDGKPLRYIE